jgi:anaerobic selenocysteine-containing dehydrogenase
VTVTGDQITRIEGNPEDVLSHGYICPKATAMGGLHYGPDRPRTPVRRLGDLFEPIGWDEAFGEIGRRLRKVRRQHGPHAIAMYMGNPASHTSAVIHGGLLRAVLSTRNFYSASSIDQLPQEFVAWQMFGSSVLMPVADIDRTDRLVIMGANPAVSNGSVTTMPNAKQRIRDVRTRRTVVVIDPRRTETARLADEHVAIAPGSDVYLLLAMLHVLVTENLCDESKIRAQCTGWDELRALVAEATPEMAAPLAGVDAEAIRRLAREHAAADSAVLYARIGVCQQVTGTLTHWLVNAVNAVTGNLDRPGGRAQQSAIRRTGLRTTGRRARGLADHHAADQRDGADARAPLHHSRAQWPAKAAQSDAVDQARGCYRSVRSAAAWPQRVDRRESARRGRRCRSRSATTPATFADRDQRSQRPEAGGSRTVRLYRTRICSTSTAAGRAAAKLHE